MAKVFSIGDVVILKSGSPQMTIISITYPGDVTKEYVQVVFYQDNKPEPMIYTQLPTKALMHVEDKQNRSDKS